MAIDTATEAEVAWLAGLFEGEGSVAGSQRQKQAPTLGVIIRMTDKDVIERCLEVAGVGRIYGPYQPSYAGAKPYWAWQVQSSKQAYAVLQRLFPLLGDRRRGQIVNKALPFMLHKPLPRNRNRVRLADGRLA